MKSIEASDDSDDNSKCDKLQKVKQKYRPDWLDSDNKLYINKLNKMVQNYDKAFQDINLLRAAVFKTHKEDIMDIKENFKKLNEDYGYSKDKLFTLEDSIPAMIREMVQFYIDQKVEQRLVNFVTYQEMIDKVSLKLDFVQFNQFKKKLLEKEFVDDTFFKIDERFFEIERRIANFVSSDQLQTELQMKVQHDKFNELLENVNRIKQNSEQDQKNFEKKLKNTNEELVKKSEELNEGINKLQQKIKEIEDELNEEDSSDASSKNSLTKSQKSKSSQSRKLSGKKQLEKSVSVAKSATQKESQIQIPQHPLQSDFVSLKESLVQNNQSQVYQETPQNDLSKNLDIKTFENNSVESLYKRDSELMKKIQSKNSIQQINQIKKNSNLDLDIVNGHQQNQTHSLKLTPQQIVLRDTQSFKQSINIQIEQSQASQINREQTNKIVNEDKDINKNVQNNQDQKSIQQQEEQVQVLKNPSSQQIPSPFSNSIDVNIQLNQKKSTQKILSQKTLIPDDNKQKSIAKIKEDLNIDIKNVKAGTDYINDNQYKIQSAGMPLSKDQEIILIKDQKKNDEKIKDKNTAKQKKEKKNEGDEESSESGDSYSMRKSSISHKKTDKMSSIKGKKVKQESLLMNKEFINSQKLIQDQFKVLEDKLQNQFQNSFKLVERINKAEYDIKELNKVESRLKVEPLQRKIIMMCLTEALTPVKRNFNVDLKNMRKYVEECLLLVDENKEANNQIQKQINSINTQLMRQLKNNDVERDLLGREIDRLNKIDRIKVQNARTCLFNPDNGNLLPSFDTMYASNKNNQSINIGSVELDPKRRNSITKEIITKNELKGECERFGAKPSQRERIVIVRSQQQHFRSKTSLTMNPPMTANHNIRIRGINTVNTQNAFVNDSMMSNNSYIGNSGGRRQSVTQGMTGFGKSINNSQSPPKETDIDSQQVSYIDIQKPEFPNALQRNKIKNIENHKKIVDRKLSLAQKLESSRQTVREKYNLKTMI